MFYLYMFILQTVQTSETRKQEAIHRLLSLELDFIDLMHSGMQRYSRPLRHCILSHSQHAAVFQNIEKVGLPVNWAPLPVLPVLLGLI